MPSGLEPRIGGAQETSGRASQPKECAGAHFLAQHHRLCLLVSLVSAPQSADRSGIFKGTPAVSKVHVSLEIIATFFSKVVMPVDTAISKV